MFLIMTLKSDFSIPFLHFNKLDVQICPWFSDANLVLDVWITISGREVDGGGECEDNEDRACCMLSGLII